VATYEYWRRKASREIGYMAGGFMHLAKAVQPARAIRDAGAPWGNELIRRYQTVLDHHAAQYHPRS
jgi:hypothetical protein